MQRHEITIPGTTELHITRAPSTPETHALCELIGEWETGLYHARRARSPIAIQFYTGCIDAALGELNEIRRGVDL